LSLNAKEIVDNPIGAVSLAMTGAIYLIFGENLALDSDVAKEVSSQIQAQKRY
tara:strand:+ start:215 stop:373 length:159 start_codon:yes stop_codon:yes gene_type:complete